MDLLEKRVSYSTVEPSEDAGVECRRACKRVRERQYGVEEQPEPQVVLVKPV